METEHTTTVKKLMRHERMLRRRDVSLAFIFPLALLLVWEFTARTGILNPLLFPPPTVVFQAGWELIKSGSLLVDLKASLLRIIIGYLIGASLGIITGLAVGYFRALRAALTPTLYALYAIPKIAILPLLLLIFGLGETTKIMIVAIPVFFVMEINTMAGVHSINAGILEAGRSYGANGFKLFRYVILPGSLPSIFTGFRVATGIAVLVVVAAEFVAADTGIGYLIWNSWSIFQPDQMYVGLVTVSLLGATLTGFITLMERIALPWKKGERNE